MPTSSSVVAGTFFFLVVRFDLTFARCRLSAHGSRDASSSSSSSSGLVVQIRARRLPGTGVVAMSSQLRRPTALRVAPGRGHLVLRRCLCQCVRRAARRTRRQDALVWGRMGALALSRNGYRQVATKGTRWDTPEAQHNVTSKAVPKRNKA